MMNKYLITGFSGFVSMHFLEYLESNKIESIVLGVDISTPIFDITTLKYVKCSYKKLDLLNRIDVSNTLSQFGPTHILHLASYSSVAFSWQNPFISFTNNTNVLLTILEEVRFLSLNCRILSVGSSEEYGNVVKNQLPLTEESILNPISPYAVARVSQEMLSKIYADGYGLDIVMTRSFNHIGIGQKDIFVISSFAKQFVEIKKGKLAPKLIVGDISIVRDFVDVLDVVDAYFLLFKKGEKGEVYNVCSGIGVSLKEIIFKMQKIIGIEVEIQIDDKLIRPNDNKIIIGSNEKIKKNIGWSNKISLEKSLKDILKFYWEKG